MDGGRPRFARVGGRGGDGERADRLPAGERPPVRDAHRRAGEDGRRILALRDAEGRDSQGREVRGGAPELLHGAEGRRRLLDAGARHVRPLRQGRRHLREGGPAHAGLRREEGRLALVRARQDVALHLRVRDDGEEGRVRDVPALRLRARAQVLPRVLRRHRRGLPPPRRRGGGLQRPRARLPEIPARPRRCAHDQGQDESGARLPLRRDRRAHPDACRQADPRDDRRHHEEVLQGRRGAAHHRPHAVRRDGGVSAGAQGRGC